MKIETPGKKWYIQFFGARHPIQLIHQINWPSMNLMLCFFVGRTQGSVSIIMNDIYVSFSNFLISLLLLYFSPCIENT